jgi:hypothetical protein
MTTPAPLIVEVNCARMNAANEVERYTETVVCWAVGVSNGPDRYLAKSIRWGTLRSSMSSARGAAMQLADQASAAIREVGEAV